MIVRESWKRRNRGPWLAVILVLVCVLLDPRGLAARHIGEPTTETVRTSTDKEPYLVDSWDRSQGLPQSSVLALAQDSGGFLWLATQTGVVRFDGQSFEVLDHTSHPTIRDSYVEDLVGDGESGLWLATHDGLVHLGQKGQRRYGIEDGLVDDNLQTLHHDARGSLWIGSAGGLSKLEGENFTSFTTADGMAHDSVWAIEDDPAGGLWIGTEAGLSLLANQRFTHYPITTDARGSQVFDLLRDQEGTLWVASVAGISTLRGDRLVTPPELETLVQGAAQSLFEDEDGTLWIGGEGGLVRRPASGDRPVLYGLEDGLPDREIRSILRDHEGSLWIGTSSRGLARLRPGKFQGLGIPEGLVDDFIWSVFEDSSGVLWAGAHSGMSRIEPSGLVQSWKLDHAVRMFFEDRSGRLWIGTLQGLFEWVGGRLVPRIGAAELPFPRVNCMAQTTDGTLWFGSEGGGVYRLDDSAHITRQLTAADGLPHQKIRAMVADPEGGLWLATQDGLAHWDGDRIRVWTTEDGLSDDYILALHLDSDGDLWIGTAAGGLNLWRDEHFVSFNRRNGMADNLVLAIVEDHLGSFWLTSNSGLVRVARSELESLARGVPTRLRPVTYDEQDGLRSSELNGGSQPSAWRLADGRLAFSTLAGVTLVDPSQVGRNSVPPPIHLGEVMVDGESRASQQRVEVEAGVKDLELRWVALSYLHPERVRYRYRLIGFDEDWVEAEGRRFAHYTRLPPGHYRFEVIAANSDGIWNMDGAHLELEVHPAFHQTWTFYLLAVLTLVGTGHLVHRYLVRRLIDHNRDLRRIQSQLEAKNEEVQAKNLELERFTYAVSHDLKSPLFTIEGFLGLVERDAEKGEMEKLRADMARIRRATGTMRQLLDELLDLSRVGRKDAASEAVDLAELAHEATELVAGRINEKGVTVEIVPPMPVVLGVRTRLLQVFQNLIDNAVKFMDDQAEPRIEIRALANGTTNDEGARMVEVQVQDNGRGIAPEFQEKIFGLFDQLDADAEGTGIGLALVRRILDTHGGTIHAESQGAGHGTTFYFTLPGAVD